MLDLSQNTPNTAKTFVPSSNNTNFSTGDPKQRRENFSNNNGNFNKDQRPKREFNNNYNNKISSSTSNVDELNGPPVFVGKVKCYNEVEEKPPKEIKETRVIKENKDEAVDIDRPVFINSNKNIDVTNEEIVEKNFSQLVIQDVSFYNLIKKLIQPFTKRLLEQGINQPQEEGNKRKSYKKNFKGNEERNDRHKKSYNYPRAQGGQGKSYQNYGEEFEEGGQHKEASNFESYQDDDKYRPEYVDETENINEDNKENMNSYNYKKSYKKKKYNNNYENYGYDYGYGDYNEYPENYYPNEKYDQSQSSDVKQISKDKVIITCEKSSLKEMFN